MQSLHINSQTAMTRIYIAAPSLLKMRLNPEIAYPEALQEHIYPMD